MKKNSLNFMLAGFILGLIAALIMLRYIAPPLLFLEDDSRFGFDDSIALLEKAAKENKWVIPKQYRLDSSLKKAGYDILPVSVIELCRPDHAAKILGKDEFRHFSTLMPCRVSVYEKSDGTVAIARLNTSLMSRLFDPAVAKVMAQATTEIETILNEVTTE